jgi:hypothetical protein
MRKFVITLFAALVAAFSAAELSEAGPRFRPGEDHGLVVVQNGWKFRVTVPGCWVRKTWKRDYAGNLYLKKVRVCA